MKVRCEYCGSYISNTDDECPNCGAVNENLMRSGTGAPKTIEELKAWCQKRNLPLEKMRFFIGVNCKDPRCFGIYKDTYGNFIVYKNKSDGSRAIRYEGTDEAYAVNEIYMKLKEEIQHQVAVGNISHKQNKNASKNNSAGTGTTQQANSKVTIFLVVIIIALALIWSAVKDNKTDRNNTAYSQNYYSYDDDYYYHSSQGDWYVFDDDSSSWDSTDAPTWSDDDDDYQSSYEEFKGAYGESYSYQSDTDFYDDYSSSSDFDDDDWDSDYDYDYDYDSWDSGSSSWDSDW